MIIIDNAKYGIYNDGTHPAETTAGINLALADHAAAGQTTVGLAPRTYLIADDVPITIPQWTTLDLNGSTLKKEPNSNENYQIVFLPNDHSGVRNGIVVGDKDEHDYSNGATHEGGSGILVAGAEFVTIQDVEIKNCTGDGVTIGNRGFCYVASGMSYFTNPAIGRFATAGTWSDSADGSEGWVYFPSHKLDLFRKQANGNTLEHSRFQIGGNGYDKYCLDIDYYVMTYYDESLNCLGFSAPTLVSEDVYAEDILAQYPTARYVAFSFKAPYDAIASAIASWNPSLAPQLRTIQMSTHVMVERCHIHHCRRQGITGGGKFLHVKDCHIHDIRGTAPSYGIDVEDGYSFNQEIRIEGCKIERNAGGCIVICNSRDVAIRDCQLSGFVQSNGKGNGTGVCFYQSDAAKNIIEHCHMTGVYNAIADSTARDCWFEACTIGGRLENCTLRDCRLQSADAKIIELHNCKVYRTGIATQKIDRVIVRDCNLVDCGTPNAYFFPQDDSIFVFENNVSANGARHHNGRENAWPLVTFTSSSSNGAMRLIRIRNNTYRFDNADTVRPLFDGLILKDGGRAEIRHNTLMAHGCIQSIGTLTTNGNAYMDISDNSFKTTYASYLTSCRGINLTGKAGDCLVLERNTIELKKNRKPTMTITGIPTARLLHNSFDAALVFDCADGRVYAEGNTATSIDFGNAAVTSVSGNSSDQMAAADLTEVHEAIDAMKSNMKEIETAHETLRNDLANVQNSIANIVGSTAVEKAKFKQMLANILTELCGMGDEHDS